MVMGMSGLQKLMVIQVLILEIEVKFISVGIVIRRENFMKKLMMILSMMVLLTNCTKSLEFDGFDPTTTVLRWMIKDDAK
jgi:hypothetical protein